MAAMRSLWFLPLTFLAGVHGFAIVAPYVAVIFAALHLRSRHRARRAAALVILAPASDSLDAAIPGLVPA